MRGKTSHRPSVLVVEDDPDIRIVLHDLLENDGYHVEEASSCCEALARVEVSSFSSVLLDRGLPDGDGLSLIEPLRNLGRVLPIIVLSAYTSSGCRGTHICAGAFSWLSKPYDRATLSSVVREAVAHSAGRNPTVSKT